MRRREFLSLLGGTAAWPLSAQAQQPERIRTVGVLVPAPVGNFQTQSWVAAFRDELQKLGWSEGRNLRIEERWSADGETLRTAIAELVKITPDVVLTATASASRPMSEATQTIPIVFANVPDPVALRLVQSLSRPGGNITGFANYEPSIAIKWLELLKQIAPHVTRVGVIYDPANPTMTSYLRIIETAAPSFGIEFSGATVRNSEDIERALSSFSGKPNGGLIVPSGPATVANQERLIALAVRYRLPSVYPTREAVMSGALASYGIDTGELFRNAASYIDRILKGEKPGDLPIQFATKFELLINLKTAKMLGLDPPLQLLARTDEVIE
jgi:putative tryptophan/tyrosine transport system substrate-binding protein